MDEEEDAPDDSGGSSEPEQQSNLYNVFKSANSLFSRPLFGTSQQMRPTPEVRPEYPDQEEEKVLFSGSLFGSEEPENALRRN